MFIDLAAPMKMTSYLLVIDISVGQTVTETYANKIMLNNVFSERNFRKFQSTWIYRYTLVAFNKTYKNQGYLQ